MYNAVELPGSMEGTHQEAPAADEMQPLVSVATDKLNICMGSIHLPLLSLRCCRLLHLRLHPVDYR